MIFGTNANEMNYWIGELGGLFKYSLGMPIKYKADLKLINEEDLARVKEFSKKLKVNNVWRITEFYNELMFRLPAILQAEGHANNDGNVYMYYWKEESKIPLFKACHAVELAYVFYNIEETIYTGEVVDEALARATSTMWVNFAKTGVPSFEDVSWSKYDIEDRNTLVFKKDQIAVEKDILKEQRELLSPLLRYMINPGYANLDMSMTVLGKTKALVDAMLNNLSILVEENIIK